MNFDMLNPLTSYLSRHAEKEMGEMGDWGIEDTISTTSYRDERDVSRDFAHYYHKYVPNPISATNDNFSKYIRKYLSLGRTSHEFWEKFKYTLVVSNLLEDAMILSKNEQALAALESKIPVDNHVAVYSDALNDDGTRLAITKRYLMTYPYRNSRYLLLVINMIIYLLKQNLQKSPQKIPFVRESKILKIILIVATRIIKYQRAALVVRAAQTQDLLNEFLLSNYRLNKMVVNNLIGLKEMSMFGTCQGNLSVKDTTSILHLIHSNLHRSVATLLPCLNGELLEQYCSINNVNLEMVTMTWDQFVQRNKDEDVVQQTPGELDEVVFGINKLDQLRKLLVCAMLTLHDSPAKRNFFLVKLMDQFGLACGVRYVSNINKIHLLRGLLMEHNKTSEVVQKMYKKEGEVKGVGVEGIEGIDGRIDGYEPSTELHTLISKVSCLASNLKFFEKYHSATRTLNSIDELNEKMMIFRQFSDDLAAIQELYQVNVSDLNDELSQAIQRNEQKKSHSDSSSSVTSPRSSIDNSTGLRMFHNTAIKKRYSLPAERPTFGSPESSSGKKYKRLSTGLQLGLLTVFEEKGVSFDDNYINMNAPQSYEVYNQLTLEQLSQGKKRTDDISSNGRGPSNDGPDPNRNGSRDPIDLSQIDSDLAKSVANFPHHRFSLNSVNSNLSGLTDMINSTQRTSIDDDGFDLRSSRSPHLTNEELTKKLEESFSRIYSLEKELKTKKVHTVSSYATIVPKKDETSPSNHSLDKSNGTASDIPDSLQESNGLPKGFLSELENKLDTVSGTVSGANCASEEISE